MRSPWPVIVAVACCLSVVAVAQSQSKKKAAPKSYSYVFTLKSGKYTVTSSKLLPMAEFQQVFADAASAGYLRSSAASAARELSMAKLQIDSLQSQIARLQSENTDLEQEKDELSEKLEEAHDAASDIQHSAAMLDIDLSSLERAVGWFDYMDWKNVVPDVQRKTRSIVSDFDDLKREIDDLDTLSPARSSHRHIR